MRRHGFTLVELLVVIAIIGILVSLLLPAVQAARESGRRVQCQNNLKQLALACLSYHDQHQYFPPSCNYPAGQDPETSTSFGRNWVISILPMLEQENLFHAFDLTKPISDAANRTARGTVVPAMVCPSDSGHGTLFNRSGEGDNWARGNYAANGSLGFLSNSFRPANGPTSQYWQSKYGRGVMGSGVSVNIAQIRDGTTNTIMLGELKVGLAAADRRGTWAMGAVGASSLWGHGTDDAIGPNDCSGYSDNIMGCSEVEAAVGAATLQQNCMTCCDGCNSTQATTRSWHTGGVFVAMCDGSVHFISDFIEKGNVWELNINNIDLTTFLTWQRLNTSADLLPIDSSKY